MGWEVSPRNIFFFFFAREAQSRKTQMHSTLRKDSKHTPSAVPKGGDGPFLSKVYASGNTEIPVKLFMHNDVFFSILEGNDSE